MSSLQFSQVQEHELAWLDGVVTLNSGAVPVIDAAPNKVCYSLSVFLLLS